MRDTIGELYGSKHSSQLLSDKPFVRPYMKSTGYIGTFSIWNDCSTIGDIPCVVYCCKSTHRSFSDIKIVCVHLKSVYASLLHAQLRVTPKLTYLAWLLTTHQTTALLPTALLPEMMLCLVRIACEWGSASYGSKNTSQTLSYAPFCACLHAQNGEFRIYIRNTIGELLSVLTLVTWKLQIVYERCTYRMTALLSEVSIFCVRAGCKIGLVSYGSNTRRSSFR